MIDSTSISKKIDALAGMTEAQSITPSLLAELLQEITNLFLQAASDKELSNLVTQIKDMNKLLLLHDEVLHEVKPYQA